MTLLSNKPLFLSDANSDKAAKIGTFAPLLYRRPASPRTVDTQIEKLLLKVGCQLAINLNLSDSAKNLRPNREAALEPETATGDKAFDFRGFIVGNQSFDTHQISRCSSVEWLWQTSDFTNGAIDKLQQLQIAMPIDVDQPDRLRQRISMLRQCCDADGKLGIGCSLPAAMANQNLLAELDLDFITLFLPEAVVPSNHPAMQWLRMPIVEVKQQLQQLRRKIGRSDLKLVLQPPLQSGYDAAGYLSLGADALYVNAMDFSSAEPVTNKVDSFTEGLVAADLTRAATRENTTTLIAAKVEQFLAEFRDATIF